MSPDFSNLYCADAVRSIETVAAERLGLGAEVLMERAAQGAWRTLRERWPQARRIGIACGPGNNGGDGFVLARLARAGGCAVQVLQWPGGAPRGATAQSAAQAWHDAGGETHGFSGALPEVDLWVDALFGIGLARPPEGPARALIEAINGAGRAVLALDVPSGVYADTGDVPGVAIHADLTLSFLVAKRGLHTGAALDQVGVVRVDALGVPASVLQATPPAARLVAGEALAARLPARRPDSHKGDFGHVLCVGGDHGMAGAVALAGEAALRCGAGLVSVGTRPEHAPALLARRPELMVRGIDEDADFTAAAQRASVVAVGPGLGTGEWGRALLAAALATGKPLVLDADALNLLAASPRVLPDAVLTPHPGEAARLLGTSTAQVQADRFAAAAALVERYGCAVVLKGAGSVVAAPGQTPSVLAAGNPGMASGGMGDVLTGVIAALRAQGLPAADAAVAGALLHATAADAAARDGQRGMLAADLFPYLRHCANP